MPKNYFIVINKYLNVKHVSTYIFKIKNARLPSPSPPAAFLGFLRCHSYHINIFKYLCFQRINLPEEKFKLNLETSRSLLWFLIQLLRCLLV